MPAPDNDLSSRRLGLLWALLVGFVALCHWDWLVLGLPIEGLDIATYYTPFYEEYARRLAQGQYPFWTNMVFSGHPILAEGQASLLHPLQIFLLRFAGHTALGWWLYLHGLIGAAGAWLYCRKIGASRLGATLAAWAMGLCGFFAVRTIHPNYYAAGAYLVWQLYAIEHILRGRRTGAFVALLALASGLQWLCGHPQVPVLAGYYCGLYAFLRILPWWSGEEELAGKWRVLPVVAGALALGLALAGIQLVPLLRDVVAWQSERAGELPFSFFTRGSLPPWGLLVPFFPALYGTAGATAAYLYWLGRTGYHVGPWESHTYLGAVVMLLAIYALVHLRERRIVRVHLALGALAVLFALGKFTPVFWLIWHLPGLHQLRVPSRALVLLMMALLPLAALGFDALLKQGEHARARIARIGRRVLLVAVAAWAIFGIGMRVLQPMFIDQVTEKYVAVEKAKQAKRGEVHPATLEFRLDHARKVPREVTDQVIAATAFDSALTTNVAFYALAALVLAALAGGKLPRRQGKALVFVLLAAEMLWFHRTIGAEGPDVPDGWAPPAYANLIPEGTRVFGAFPPRTETGAHWSEQRESLPAHISVIWNIPTADGRTSMQPNDYLTMLEPMRARDYPGPERIKMLESNTERLRLLGVGAVVTGSSWGTLSWKRLYENSRVSLWQVPDPAPNAYLTAATGLEDTESWRAALGERYSSPASSARIAGVLSDRQGSVHVEDAGHPDRERLFVEAPAPLWLIRTIRNTPDWHAYSGGEALPIKTVLGFFQGVRVPAGQSEVEFRYEPASFYWGSRISALAALVLLALLGLSLYRARRQNP